MNRITLSTPVKWGSETVTELVFRDLIAKDLRALKLNNMEFGDLLNLAARLSGHPPSFIDQLSGKDAMKAVELAGKSLNSGM